jgi:ABC-type polysaccharide/polyol phosphate transport system ATPase subunit
MILSCSAMMISDRPWNLLKSDRTEEFSQLDDFLMLAVKRSSNGTSMPSSP